MIKSLLKTKCLLLFALLAAVIPSKADEGMWLPHLLTNNYAEMQKMGIELTPEQIYSVNNSSLKDAIVRLGSGFCTGEMISDQGLLLTNHHCGYGVIQEKSSTEHDYLKDGFWAMDKSKELPAGFSVSFLVKIVEVSDEVLEGVAFDEMGTERQKKIADNIEKVKKDNEDEKYELTVKSMFSGNKYYLFVYQTFQDVRLVGAPPSSVGKFGGDTDNWMWPRQTGDFSMFRVYADKDNNPAEYSTENVPYKPKHHLPISLQGVDTGDFVMIFGYPGSTDRYLTSYGVQYAIEKDQPSRVKIRRAKLDIYEEGMNNSDAVRIAYAAKHAQVSNYWKYFIGQTAGLKRLHVYDKKQNQETAFVNWVNEKEDRKEKYGEVMDMYEKSYAMKWDNGLAGTYFFEAVYGIELVQYGFTFAGLRQLYEAKEELEDSDATPEEIAPTLNQITATIDRISRGLDDHFKDYNVDIDKKVFVKMIEMYTRDIKPELRAEGFNELWNKNKKDPQRMADKIYKKTMLIDKEAIKEFLENPSHKALKKDPGVELGYIMLNYYYNQLQSFNTESDALKASADRLYKAGLIEMNPDKNYYPNANSTMRMTYGMVGDYAPKDAVHFNYYTTANGILEKFVKGDHEFDVPEKLLELIRNKDFGQYAQDGELRVCFISNNDITGGNSGSPVINAKGHLVGTAFDGNWEAMSGDIAFEPELQRTISVDVRYTLFIIEKLAGAKHLVDEMTIIR